jgi:hypothetical protein
VFDPGQVNQDRTRPDPDRMIAAELTGAAQRNARWRELTEAETAEAVAELQEIAAGRTDLLAEVAGIGGYDWHSRVSEQRAFLCAGRSW